MTTKRAKAFRFTLVCFWKLFTLSIVLLGLSAFIFWLMFPRISNLQGPIETRLSTAIQHETSIGGLHAGWHGLRPYIGLTDIRVLHPQTHLTFFHLEKAEIQMDLIETIRQRKFMHGEISLVGFAIQLLKMKDGGLALQSPGLPQTQAKIAEKEGAFNLKWLTALGQQEILVKSGVIRLHDETSGKTYFFRDIEALAKHDINKLQLRGLVSLPIELGSSLSFFVDASGDFTDLASLSGTSYVKGVGLNAKAWGELTQISANKFPEGRVSPEIWLNYSNGRLSDVVGTMEGTSIAASENFMGYSFISKYYLEPQSDGWALNIRDLAIDDGHKTWPATTAKITFSGRDDGGSSLVVGSSFFRLEDGVRLLSGMSELPFSKPLLESQPQGDIYQLYLSINTRKDDKKEQVDYLVQGDFEKAGWQAFNGMPGMSNLSGNMNFSHQGGIIQLDARNAVLTQPKLFDKPLPIALLKGSLVLKQSENSWSIDGRQLAFVSPDIQAKGGFQLRNEKKGKHSPILNMSIQVGKGKLAHIANYFPTLIMKPKLTRWLGQAFEGGRISKGNIVYRGRLGDFPFRKSEGKFGAQFYLNDAVFQYASGWPKLHAVNGKILFEGTRFDAYVKGGVLGSRLDDVHVSIKDMSSKSSVVHIKGRALGSPQDGLDHLTTTPLKDKFGPFFENIRFSQGKMNLSLDIDFPLQAGRRLKLYGNADFRGSALTISTDKKPIIIDKINGELKFTEAGFSGDDLSSTIFSIPASLSVKTETASKKSMRDSSVIVSAQGAFSPSDVGRITGFPWGKWMEGSAHWESTLTVNTGANPGAFLSIASNMKGIEADLPPPFNKTRKEVMPLVMKINFSEKKKPPWLLQYGQVLSGTFLTGSAQSDLALQRAEFILGHAKAKLPKNDIIRIKGQGVEISWSEWSDFLYDLPSSSVYQEVQLDIQAKRAEFLQRKFDDITIKGIKKPNQWFVNLGSKSVSGAIHIPTQSSVPIKVVLDHFHLNGAQVIKKTTVSTDLLVPGDVPPFSLETRNFTYNGMKFGRLQAVVSSQPNALDFKGIEVRSENTVISGDGLWKASSKSGQQTTLNLTINTKNAAATLRDWQYFEGLDDGKGDAKIKLHWVGSPRDFSLKTVSGSIDLSIKEGRLLNIEPGAGRIFGLLSLQSFSKRLALDFSDIFNKGFSFETLVGTFEINEGNARTENFFMEGPAARLETQGRIGLIAKDYDQRVTVVPQVGSSLPVAGALAAGVGVGAAVFVIQKIFEPQIDKIVSTQYSVTGPWDNPVFKKIIKEKK